MFYNDFHKSYDLITIQRKKLAPHWNCGLQKRLKKLDIEAYNTIAIDNPHRLIRSLEICIGTGETYSSFKNKPKAPRNFQSIKIGLTADREIMYDRINRRVAIMIEKGLIKEAKKELNVYK